MSNRACIDQVGIKFGIGQQIQGHLKSKEREQRVLKQLFLLAQLENI